MIADIRPLRGPALTRTHDSISAALRTWGARTPDALALTTQSVEQTYAQLASSLERTAAQLAACGVGAGDRLVIVGENTLAWVHLYLGALRLGAIACPANNRLNPQQLADQVALLDARVATADERHDALVGLCPTQRVISGTQLRGSATRSLPDLDDVVSGDAPAVVSFTSGTTSAPKGAVLTHRAIADASAVFAQVLQTNRHSSTLVMVPLFHNTGFIDQLGHMLIVGGRTDLLRCFRTADAIAAAAARPTTFVTAVPSILRMITVTAGAEAVYGPATDVLYGGSPMPGPWSRELLDRWPHLRLHHGYGLTEFSSACSFLPPELTVADGESIGTPAPGVTLRIVDPDSLDTDVPDGMPGEVWVKGSTRMREYWGQPELTATKLHGDWLRTGDIGRYDHGRLYLDGRTDDVINRGGEKVLPSYVEAKIAELAQVAQVVVFGAPHPVLQHRVVAALELRPGQTFARADAVAHLQRNLPDYAIPEEFIVSEALPRTASGKLDRRAVARAYHPPPRSNSDHT
jgi:long-chain acyl-CoA synthetase